LRSGYICSALGVCSKTHASIIQEKQALVDRLATPDDIAGLASYLVSKEAAKITGKYFLGCDHQGPAN
jgi:NAD(P)-dependent dehydrogenase (short-subunit alcohol dehydrogenase family)